MSKALFLISMLFVCQLFSQTKASFEVLSANEGLSQGMVFDILQTHDGFLWIATKDGLNRYDGYRFEVFSNDPFDPFSIGGNEVRSLYEDSRGWLWVCYPAGVDVFQPSSGKFYHVLKSEDFGIKWLSLPMAETSDGGVWAALDNSVLKIELRESDLQNALSNHKSVPNIKLAKIDAPAGNNTVFNSIKFDNNENLYFGSNTGLYHIAYRSSQPSLIKDELYGDNVSIIKSGTKEKIWIQGGGWIAQLDNDAGIPRKIAIDLGKFIFIDQANNLWDIKDMSLRKWRVPTLNKNRNPALELALNGSTDQYSNFYITATYLDKTGNLWVGTNGYGLRKFMLNKSNFNSIFNGISMGSMVEAPDNGVFFKNRYNSIYYNHDFTTSLPNPWFLAIPSNLQIQNILFDKTGNGWARCISETDAETKLCRIDSRSKAVSLFPFRGEGLGINKDGKLLSLSYDSLYEFDVLGGKMVQYPFGNTQKKNFSSNNYYSTIYTDASGAIWIYEYEGLIKASPSPEGYQFQFFKNEPNDIQSLSNNFVLTVAEDPLQPDRFLWVGTKGGGLNRLDRNTGKFRHFKTEQGLPNNVVYGILQGDKGSPFIWLSTNKGLCRFDVRAETVKNFTVADGLQNNEFNSASYLKLKDGTMLFGGINGLNSFHPDSLQFNQHVPQVAITRLFVNNIVSPLQQTAVFAHDVNLISLEFAALDFTNPTQNAYRYKLLEVDKDWIKLGTKNSVQFANLAPGKYVFQVQGSNNDGVWSSDIAEFRFTIRPPWWQSKLAYILYVLAFLGMIYALYQFQLNRVKMRNQLAFEHREAERLAELDRIKTNFFSNVTHEFRTPLTLILEPVRQMLTEDEGGRFRERLQMVSRNGDRLMQLVNQLLDLAKLESGKMALDLRRGQVMETIRPIYQSFLPQAEKKGIALKMKAPPVLPDCIFDGKILETVVTNLLSNAVKFTEAGTVILALDFQKQLDHGNLELTVSDTGPGIPADALPLIFDRFYQVENSAAQTISGTGIGLALTKELVELMGGNIHVESGVGKGTRFTVQLPLKLSEGTEIEVQKPNLPSFEFDAETPAAAAFATPKIESGKLVLLIEDNAELRLFIKNTLEKQFQIVEASNGADGVKKALELIPDLIISDLMMPEKNGFEVCNELKTNELTSHVPFILLTAKSSIDSKLQGLRTGADEYLTKPFHSEELLVRMENLLENRRRLQEKFGVNTGVVSKKTEAFLSKIDSDFLRKFSLLIEQHLSDEKITVEDFAAKMHISRVQLHRKLTALTNQSATGFVRNYRLDRAMELLKNKEGNVSQVAFMVGFGSEKYFSTTFKERFGHSPSEVL